MSHRAPTFEGVGALFSPIISRQLMGENRTAAVINKQIAPDSLDLRRGHVTSFPPNQVNDSNKGSNGPAGSRSGKLHSERGMGSA